MTHPSTPLHPIQPLLSLLLLAFAPLAAAQNTPVLPGAGTILRQVQPQTPPPPAPAATGLSIEQEQGAALPVSAPFRVSAIRIAGNQAFDTATLQALVADAQGATLTLAQLGALAGRITEHYRANGYPLARAVIPAQTIQNGLVRIDVLEARYGKISVSNASGAGDALLQATLDALQTGRSIGQGELDRTLLLLSDIPNVAIAATLKPGAEVGSADLLVDAWSGPAVAGNAVLDNNGNRYTGRARAGATVHLYNPLHHGDVLSVSVLSSGQGMRYARLGYDTLLNGRGSRVGASYSALRYRLGHGLSALDAHGSAQVASAWIKHPLLRSRDVNLYGQLQYDRVQLRDRIDASAVRSDRQIDNWSAALSGDARDGLLQGGISSWNLAWTAGHASIDNPQARRLDAASARSHGDFAKWNVNLSRLQNLGQRDALYLSVAGQWADSNLDSAEKMSVGGPYTVRAYDTGAAAGDLGYTASVELRHELGAGWGGQWQAVAFVDSARVTVNQRAWSAGPNGATLQGAGLGLNWNGPQQWDARIHVAKPIGATPSLLAARSSARVWAELRRSF
ncbi:ShlB/FhaC/HecB family hemolysin secretion/activation protein [Janthinobacterium fluminis]|uniref:ShlB/FhaC/HecB family hemolysin secretion/activation protein n=1 Tax=Janthinobacterium fluminis TaxID=2987524 RepID=A0ABT5JYV9_9BURK|nr:ShlB/FhaC/HecB family hemolysin secretion/activation protein [Janthinobacterium fluminis]MDC8757834.1 ShlB/FhaC/HecB family hemolysin secretion/activation protein [Janthinobacterium fluminis]